MPPADPIRGAVAQALAAQVPAHEPVAVAVSGGRDSVVLLDALHALAGSRVRAVHVHHGLSANASQWERFCVDSCNARGIPLAVRHVDVSRAPRTSIEGEARRARYAALADAANEMRVRFVALAHHRDDQAETLLLQLLRGAGPHGLAAMSALREDARDVVWWRPLLDVARSDIDAYAAAHDLRYVDDESNDATRHRRNAIRHLVMPALTQVAGDASLTLARAAAHQAEAARIADDLARIDAAAAIAGDALDRAALAALPAHRARNLLRWFLRIHALPAPSTARLAQMLAQLTSARSDARVRLAHAGIEVGVHRGRILLHAPPPAPFEARWDSTRALVLPHGELAAVRVQGGGIDSRRVQASSLVVRSRRGGERIALGAGRPHRSLKVILQDAGMPEWDRKALPLVCCGDALVAVPGIGVAAEWQCPAGGPGIAVAWRPSQFKQAPR